MQQDQVKYCQIVGNLLKNALHFRRERIEIEMAKNKEFLLVAVTDDGPGVEPEQCESIFERYSQGKECTVTPRQGHGLGLAGARILARCLGGDIELTCSKTEGTKFELRLPMVLATE
jgi:signal transduction histidine kinase